jgi:hypothetical protein
VESSIKIFKSVHVAVSFTVSGRAEVGLSPIEAIMPFQGINPMKILDGSMSTFTN